MRYLLRNKLFLALIILVAVSTGCQSSETIKEVDTASLTAVITYEKNLSVLYFRAVKAFEVEALKRKVAFLQSQEASGKLSPEEISELDEKISLEIRSEQQKLLKDYLRVRKDWKTNLELRKLISLYLENEENTVKLYEKGHE